jgi:hypothetical protein
VSSQPFPYAVDECDLIYDSHVQYDLHSMTMAYDVLAAHAAVVMV